MNCRTNLLLLGGLLVVSAPGCTERPGSSPPALGSKAGPAPTGPVATAPPAGRDSGREAEADWLRAVRDPDPAIRARAVADTDATKVTPETAVPALIEVLRSDPADEVRWRAPMALGNFGPSHRPAAVAALGEAMLKDRHDWVRSHAALVLAGVAYDDKATARPAIPALTEALKDKAARTNAALALYNLGREASAAVPALFEALKDGRDRTSVLNALEQMDLGPEAAAGVPALVEALKGESGYERRRAALILARIGPDARAAVPALIQLLKGEDAAEAALALKRIDPEAAAKAGVP
jgi:HEAT repeat protein